MSKIKLTNGVFVDSESLLVAIDPNNVLFTSVSPVGGGGADITMTQDGIVWGDCWSHFFSGASGSWRSFNSSYVLIRKGDIVSPQASAYNNQGTVTGYGLK